MPNNPDYEQGLRDGRLASLEEITKQHTAEIDTLKKAVWLLYGAIALVGVLPTLLELVGYGE